jgi:hypothetical protein
MTQIKQYIHFIPLKDCEEPCLVTLSWQNSKELAQRQAFLDLSGKVESAQFEKMCTKELTVDGDGVIRFVEDGE